MSLINQPVGDRNSLLWATSFRPDSAQSCRVRFVEVDISGERPRAVRVIPMVKWASTIYIGAPEGTNFGVQVYNGYPHYIALPTYVEGRPDHTNTEASEPENRTPADMWECGSGQTGLICGFYDPHSRQLRPWQIVRGGSGYGSGEATFGTKAFNGLIDVYLRHENITTYRAQPKPSHLGSPNAGSFGTAKGGTLSVGDAVSMGIGESAPTPAILGDEPVGKGNAAIGAAAAQAHGHVNTGRSYQRQSQTLIQVNFELDEDLNLFLAQRLGPAWRWLIPQAPGNWWDSFSWMPASGGVASNIPVAPKPHTRRG